MGRAPDILTTGEVRQRPEIVSARWGIGTTELAELIGAEGSATGYKVGGSATAALLASCSLRAGLSFNEYAVLATDMPWPLLASQQLRKLGYLVVARSEEPKSALLVILSQEWVEWKANTDKSIIGTALRMGL